MPGHRAQPLPDCLEDVGDAEALALAALAPGPGLLRALQGVCERLDARDVSGAAAPGTDAASAVSDAVLLESVAAAERAVAHLSALRDQALGHLALRRQAEAEDVVEQARTEAEARGEPVPDWARAVRSTAPSEVAARLGVTAAVAGALLRAGVSAVGRHRATAAAMRSGRLSASTGAWVLDRLAELHAEVEDSALELGTTRRTEALAVQRAREDDARLALGHAPLSEAETAARAAADAEEVRQRAERTALAHADAVVAEAEQVLLREGASLARAAMGQRLTRAVHRADPAGAKLRAEKRRAERTVRRWPERDGQACLQLRGPAEDVALIGAALDARAQRRQDDQRAAEREAAREEGRPVDRRAVEPLDAHRFEAMKEWAVAALELAGTSGEPGTWGPVARTAASRPVVHVTVPATVVAGVTDVGAWLQGYGPIGAEAARRMAADGFWRRVLTDPVSGVAVGVDEGGYRPSATAVRLVGLRHPTSTMPGSTRSSTGPGIQVDHVVPWSDDGSGGPTEVTNLQPLGTGEHLTKHTPGGWSVLPAADDPGGDPAGGVVWRAPTGHRYPVAPAVLDDGPQPSDPPLPDPWGDLPDEPAW